MPLIFIHGVPDTHHVWDGVRAELRRDDAEAIALPGFAAPVPDGFGCTKEEYAAFVIAALEKKGAPVDLVGHDWGCAITVRVASLRPDLVRSWAGADGPVSASYGWHRLAKIFQTPGEGERYMAALEPASFAAHLVEQGVPRAAADANAGRIDGRMKDAILKLYRSAVHLGADWEPDLARIRAPGLVLWGERDEPCPVHFASVLARATKARELHLDAGHWTPLERPRDFARALEQHWKGIPS